MKFNPFAATFLVSSLFFMNYKLSQVGVPDAMVLGISLAYCLLFPWKILTPTEKGDSDETSK